jgi:hypothetical protein
MKIEKFQLRGNNSVCAGAFPLLRGRASTHLRENIDCNVHDFNASVCIRLHTNKKIHLLSQIFWVQICHVN